MKAISIVYPNGSNIAEGKKMIEVRSWLPTIELGEDLLIVENHKYLKTEGETDPDGKPVAIVKIKNVRDYLESDIPAACASRWDSGYYSWDLTDIRPVKIEQQVLAARGIYEVEFKEPTKSKINVEKYSSEWPNIFESFKVKIWPEVKDFATAMEHVGSTSVPGLAAKPVIDIDIVVESDGAGGKVIERLQKFGYTHLGNMGVPGREAFKRPTDSFKHNLYVCLQSSISFKNHILLRNHLRENQEARTQYSDLKMRLADEFAGNVDGYCKAKTPFILKILESQGFSKEELQDILGANI